MNRLSHLLPLIMGIPLLSPSAYAELVPEKNLYPAYIADPLRPTFNAQYQYYDKSDIADSGDLRFDLKMGGHLPLFQSTYSTIPWQLVLLAGFHGQFDNERSQDAIGWDGMYGLSLVAVLDKDWAVRFGSKHISAHVGDEYIERTGRQRLNYTREEIRGGLAWSGLDATTIYFESGRAINLDSAVLKHWRVQVGAQYQSSQKWYTALDISSYQENDWDSNVTFQFGLTAPSGAHFWRVGLEVYDGRSQLGEFFMHRERYLGIGLWLDL